MNKSRINIINKLVNSINLKNINFNLININSNNLYKIYKKIKPLWNDTIYDHQILNKDTMDYNHIYKIATTSLIAEYYYVQKELKRTINIIHLNDSNLDFYYINLGNYKDDKILINTLFNQSVCLSKFSKLYNMHNIIIIWIPINTNRDFTFNTINPKNLEKSIENFNAFTASGVTFGDSPRITLITRYEEISKLLLHELIHNYNLDGSSFHEHNHDLIKKYKNIKNPKTNFNINNYDYSYSMYESYTELLSSYLSMIFRNINLDFKEDLIKRYQTEIIMELLYSYNTISNLIKLNEYKNYEEFCNEKKFKGDICIYEYYYLKGLMYNNYELFICSNKIDFLENYNKIININKDDSLLKDVYNNMIIHLNFKYNFYD
jgi:hypothetical protein